MDENEIAKLRLQKEERLRRLHQNIDDYVIDTFLKDLAIFFDNEVDFNISEIRKQLSEPGAFKRIKKKAKSNKTHPVEEFIKELVRNAASGDEPLTLKGDEKILFDQDQPLDN
ncbi:MAG: hypothetical protein PHV17_01790 [Candidatus Omnitrophica bacterium]|nr:hypothetical protein [Candidatus Omnitrophota bacterium]